jgi:acyl-CoA dehydrogenase
MRMTAVRSGDGWVLNGTKKYVTNANRADIVVAFARTDAGKGNLDGVTAFIVGAGTPGFSSGQVFNKSGERLSNNAELIFKDVHVPDSDRLGEIGAGLTSFGRLQRSTSAYNAATVYGVAREALRRALIWTRTRVQGGKPIHQHQAVGTYLVDMMASLDIARTYAWRAAWAADNPEHFSVPLNAFPKIFAAEQSLAAVAKCMELFGGASIMRDVGIEKLLRDASVFLHSDGTNMILRQRVVNWLGTLDEKDFDTLWTPG